MSYLKYCKNPIEIPIDPVRIRKKYPPIESVRNTKHRIRKKDTHRIRKKYRIESVRMPILIRSMLGKMAKRNITTRMHTSKSILSLAATIRTFLRILYVVILIPTYVDLGAISRAPVLTDSIRTFRNI